MNPIDFTPYLDNFLTIHHFPKDEKTKIMNQFHEHVDTNPTIVVRIIDRVLGWRSSTMSFDFYYFNQMRWAHFVVKHITDDELKREAITYFLYLTSQYASEPAWSDYGTFEGAIRNRKNEYDLILTKEEFTNRRKYFRKVANNYKNIL